MTSRTSKENRQPLALKLIDLFSGIGGFSLAAQWLGGIETIQFVECDPFCQRVLSKHWPTVPIHNDILTYNPSHGSADIICGGFPCQDVSQAGKRAGIKEGNRSGLFYELMRVVRLVGPQYVVLENVAAITSNGLDTVLGTLAEAGFDAEWACIPAADVGACHRRDRWWCVAYASCADRSGWSEGARRRQWSTADPGRCWIPEGSGGADCAADSNRQRLERQDKLEKRQSAWPSEIARLSPDWRSYLSEPVLCRGDDGLSGRVDRLKALGNAVVPQVAMIPLARVLDLSRNA